MSDEVLGWMVGLAVTILPVAVCATWGAWQERRHRRFVAALRAISDITPEVAAGLRRMADAVAGTGISFAVAAENLCRNCAFIARLDVVNRVTVMPGSHESSGHEEARWVRERRQAE